MNKSLFLLGLFVFLSSFVLSQDQAEAGMNLDLTQMLKMDQAEKDKILSCIEILAIALKKDAKIIESTSQLLAATVQGDIVTQKITGDMLNKCYYSIDEATVSSIFSNGIFMEPEFEEDFFKYTQIDYSVYKILSPNEFQLTPETQILFMKLEQARTDYIAESKERQEKLKNEFHIFGYSLKNFPIKLNLLFTLLVFAGAFLGLIYLLSKVMKNDKKAAKKKEKNM